MDKAVTTGDWSDPCFVKAGADFKKLIDLKPFQQGFLAAPWDGAGSGAAAMAKGDGAIQLMGQWLPGTVTANSSDKKGMGDNLGWFPFPAVAGSPGDPNDGLGGGNGFAVGKNAPAETIDFLHFLVSKDAANQWGASNSGILPTTVGTEVVGHRSPADGGPGGSRQGQLRPALSRPGDHPGTRWVHQRCGRHPVRRLGLARIGRSGDRDGSQDPVVATNQRTSNGPASTPARSVSSVLT